MITLKDIKFRVEDTGREILSGIDLKIKEGEKIGITGESGSGKTTLGFLLAGIHKKGLFGSPRGELIIQDEDHLNKDKPGFAGVVLQNPESQIFCETPEEEINLSLENSGLQKEELNNHLDELLELFDLREVKTIPISKLSIGTKQRISIAAMLAMQPKLLLLDEPTNYLDSFCADKLFEYLEKLTNLTIIIIEHDLIRLNQWADRVFQLKEGKIIKEFAKGELSEHSSASKNELTNKTPSSASKVLEINDLNFAYKKDANLFENFSISFGEGEITCITGKNGSGKTTLLKLFKGLLKPQSGKILLNGKNGVSLMENIGLSFQNPDEQIFAATVKEECGYWLSNRISKSNTRKSAENQIEKSCLEVLKEFGLEDKIQQLPFTLSYGEKRRLALASIISADPDVICLDEPTVALDQENLRQLTKHIRKLAAQKKTIIFTTHDNNFAYETADRIINLDEYTVEREK